jgi:hypothetical protein
MSWERALDAIDQLAQLCPFVSSAVLRGKEIGAATTYNVKPLGASECTRQGVPK